MNTRQEQKEKRRLEILAAGLELFIRRGYTATKISDIAGAVGMSAGLLFHYFESKEKLYEELINIGISGPMGMQPEPHVQPMEYFESTARQILHYIETQPFVAKMFVLMNQAQHSGDIPSTIKARLGQIDFYKGSVELIRRGQREGSVRQGDPKALALAYWSAIQGIAQEVALTPGTHCPDSQWIADIVRG